MTDTPTFYSTTALAEYFSVQPATIISMVRNGDIPPGAYVRIGRVYRFNRAAVEEALRARELAHTGAQDEGNPAFDDLED